MKTHIIWLLVSGAAFAIGTHFAKKDTQFVDRPVEVVRTKEVVIEKPVEVVKEVPKVVEKIVEKTVEVPAEIPEAYKTALAFRERVLAGKFLSAKDRLRGIKTVSVAVYVDDPIKKLVSESDIRTKFEITLRKAGVPIDAESSYALSYHQEGFTSDSSPLLVYSFRSELDELVLAFRDSGAVVKQTVPTWTSGNYGTVGISRARDSLIASAERAAEAFANEWLSANPKP